MLSKRYLGLLGLISVSGLLAACSPDEVSKDAAQRTAEPRVVATSGCADESEVVGNTENHVGGSLEGDVDGDGKEDSVAVALAPGDPGCEAFVLVRTGGTLLSAPIEQEGFASEGAPPSLVGLADIDGRDGDEIIVRLVSGASTEFMGLFSAAGGSLERLPVEDGEFGNLFPSGGSVGHLEQSDCGAPGTVVISVAVPEGRRYLLRRSVYNFDGSGFVHDREASSRQLVEADELASGEVPGFAPGAPFASCPTD